MDDRVVVQMLADAYRDVHRQLREELAALDEAILAWRPTADTNPIAVLVIHTLGSEAEVWRIVAGVPSARDRSAEFIPRPTSRADLLARLDHADALLADLAPRIGDDELTALRPRPDRQPQTGLHWLLTNYGHAREHLAHVQLTRQWQAAGGVTDRR